MFRAPLLILLLLAACGRAAETPPLAGANIGGPFSLTDQNGRTVSDASLTGKYRIVYFGYTFCPDVCPTDVAAIGNGLKLFEKQDAVRAARVVPIFVTVDPERDTPAVLKTYLVAFHPRFVGLSGAPDAIKKVEREYGVFASKGKPTENGGYLVSHTNAAILFGPDGKPITLLPLDAPVDQVAATLDRWVS